MWSGDEWLGSDVNRLKHFVGGMFDEREGKEGRWLVVGRVCELLPKITHAVLAFVEKQAELALAR